MSFNFLNEENISDKYVIKKSDDEYLIGLQRIITSYYPSFTEVRRNNFYRVKIFKSVEDASMYIEMQIKGKCMSNPEYDALEIIPYQEMIDTIGDTNARQTAYYEEKEKADKTRRQQQYSENKDNIAEEKRRQAEINPGIYQVVFYYSYYGFGAETYEINAESINDAFEKAKIRAMKEDPNRNTFGYDKRMRFTKQFIKKIN